MFKRGCFLGVLSVLSCMLLACDSDNSSKVEDECEIDSNCLDFSADTRRGCFLISGVRVCQNSCLANNEGENAPVCYQPLSASSEPQPTVSVSDTCAKDEEGRLYSVHSERVFCDNYCNKKTGLCKTIDEVDECESNAQCAEPDAGTNRGCFRISGVRQCKDICLGPNEGKNDPVCYLPSTFAPPSEPNVSVTDTCAKDDVGRLYVVETIHEQCDNYCDEATGLCKTKVPDLTCCEGAPEGDRVYLSVSISGECACKFRCLTDSEGTSEPFCYAYMMGAPVSSTIEECAKDDYGTLYSIHTIYDYCKDNACNEDTGLCTHGNDPVIECSEEDEMQCNPPGGSAKVCTVIDGKKDCKKACFGDAEGKNAAVCYVNGSLDPSVAPQYSIVSTCKKDDNGVLYATKNDEKQCDKGCDEATGLCKQDEDPATSCSEEDEMQCNPPGGSAKVCTVIDGKKDCKEACFGDAEGKNAAVCYVNGSLDPSVAPQYSIVSTCKKDDNGVLYATKNDEKQCDNGCDEATGLCKQDEDPATSCSEEDEMQCNPPGGSAKVCTVIDGKKDCKEACFGDAEGKNAAVCYVNGSLDPSVAPQYSIVSTCKKDDNGVLYATKNDEKQCDNGCDKTTGECNLSKEEDCSTLDCNVVGGRTKTCVMISGKPSCENTCLATAEGVNEPVCYKNGALGPSAKDHSAIDTCAKDDDGKLYSVSTKMTECTNKCEDGVCK